MNITWTSPNGTISITTNGGSGGSGGVGGNGGIGGYGANVGGINNTAGGGGNGGNAGGGGGGGIGGNGGAISFLTPTAATLPNGISLLSQAGAGGVGGNGGNGGDGGSGGIGWNNGSNGLAGNGGNGGAGGNGGTGGVITGTNQGLIVTINTGISARSIGADGGNGGNGGFGFSGGNGGNAGNGGDGGVIALTNQGSITTTGANAPGISAWSQGGVGGNGGFGAPGHSYNTGGNGGNAGNGGNGGVITVNNLGSIITSGAGSHGIVATSLGAWNGLPGGGLVFGTLGSIGVGGNITIDNSGLIFVTGSDADGIRLQSSGGNAGAGKGNLLVNVHAHGVVSGGVGSGAGVHFIDGNSSTLNIDAGGTVTSAPGVNGWAVVSDLSAQFNDVINNSGLLIGSVDLIGEGGTPLSNSNTINNLPGGLFYSGSSILLGNNNVLNNAGTLLPGGPNTIMQTNLLGNYIQTATGNFVVKIGGTIPGVTHDVLAVSGYANFDGTLTTRQFGSFVPDPSNSIKHIAADTFTVLTSSDLSLAPTARLNDFFIKHYLVGLSMAQVGDTIQLTTQQSTFAVLFPGMKGLTSNQSAVAKALDKAILASGWNGRRDGRAMDLIKRLDDIAKSGLPLALDQIAPEELGLNVDAGIAAVAVHNNTVLQRMTQLRLQRLANSGATVDPAKKADGKSAVAAQQTSSNSSTGNDDSGFYVFGDVDGSKTKDEQDIQGGKNQSGGGTVGYDTQISNDLRLGIAGSYLNSDISYNSGGSTNVNDATGSVYGTWYAGNFHLDGLVGGGMGNYDSQRVGLDKANVKGSTSGADFHSLLAAGYDVPVGNFTVMPGASLAYTHLWMDGFTEHGSLAALKIEDFKNTSSLKLRIGSSAAYFGKVLNVPVTPEIGLYWQNELMDISRSVQAHLASGAGGSFTVQSVAAERNSLTPTVAVNVQLSRHVDLRLAGEASLFNKAQSYTSTLGISVGW